MIFVLLLIFCFELLNGFPKVLLREFGLLFVKLLFKVLLEFWFKFHVLKRLLVFDNTPLLLILLLLIWLSFLFLSLISLSFISLSKILSLSSFLLKEINMIFDY